MRTSPKAGMVKKDKDVGEKKKEEYEEEEEEVLPLHYNLLQDGGALGLLAVSCPLLIRLHVHQFLGGRGEGVEGGGGGGGGKGGGGGSPGLVTQCNKMYLFINLVLSCTCFCCPVALFPYLKHTQIRRKYSNIFGALTEYSNIFECLKCNKSEYEYIFEAQNIRIFEYSNIRAHP